MALGLLAPSEMIMAFSFRLLIYCLSYVPHGALRAVAIAGGLRHGDHSDSALEYNMVV